MSPELIEIHIGKDIGNFDPEKSDIFSLGLTFLRVINSKKESYIEGLNSNL